VAAATKQGAVNQSRSEVVYVHAPSGPFVFCIITKDQVDTSWDPSNAGYELIRRLTRLFWTSFEPTSSWRPVPGAERYRL
jgi:beta-lactamase class A